MNAKEKSRAYFNAHRKSRLARGGYWRLDYACSSCAACVRHLVERFRSEQDFPHEVGLFLSYPPADVKGFVDNRDNYKIIGLWKIYGDEEKAQKLCEQFRKCSERYCRLWENGVGLEKLVVAV